MHLFLPPTFDDPEQNERAAIVWFASLLGLAALMLQAVVYVLLPTMIAGLLFLIPPVVALVAVLFAVRRGWTYWPTVALVVLEMAIGTSLLFFAGGVEFPYIALMGAVAVSGALMLGARTGILLTIWTLGCALVVYFTGAQEWLLPPGQDPREVKLTLQLVTVSASGLLASYTMYRLSIALRAERHHGAIADAANVRLEKARRYTSDIVQSLADGLLVVGSDGRVVSVNDAAVRLFAVGTPEVLIGEPLVGLLGKTALQRLDAVATPGATAYGEGTILVQETEVPVRIARSPVAAEAGEIQHVFVLSDISYRVEAQRRSEEAAEAAREASRAKSQFLANMSHELRTPLNAVIGYADMLTDDLADPEQLMDVQRIRQAGQHLLTLINDVLDMSKIEAGRMDVYLEVVHLDDVLQDVAGAIRPMAQRRGNEVELVDETDRSTLYTDARKIRQILMNLGSNAAKFTEDGTITIRVTSDDDVLRVEVSDTGIGIQPEALDRLFQPFVQADDSTSRRYGGTGLGLALSLRFAEMLGGQLIARSAFGEGSTFVLELPYRQAAHTTPLPEVDMGSAPLVLCVDDDPSMLDLLGRVLRRQGLRVAHASTGEDALEIAREHKPTVITLDVMMPEMDGWTLLQRLRADPLLRDIPVVMVSMVDQDKGEALALGAADYLVKPVQTEVLMNTLRRYIERGKGRILVVDDEADMRDLLRRSLSAEGWEIAVAPNSRVALDILPEVEPDLVILDLMMPEMDGFAFVDHVRANDRWRDLPVIVLTAMELSRDEWEMLAARTSQVVQKGSQGLQRVIEEVRRFTRSAR